MNKKLYVGNLPYSIDDDQLKKLFSEFGTVESASVITEGRSGRSKGFGFVEMSSGEEAKAAMDALDEKEVEGRNLKVDEARPKKDA